MSFEIDLSGRRALITGAGHGVGRAIALAAAAAGAEVIVNDLDRDRAEGVVAEVVAAGGWAIVSVFDVTDHVAVADAVAAVDPIDILVNNAGNAGAERFALTSFVDSSPGDWAPYFAVNLYGVMHCTHAVLPGMIERGDGRVITIVSEAARRGETKMAAYSAAKAGAAGFSRAVAREVGRHGITVNNIALGTIDTQGRAEHAATDPDAQARIDEQLRAYIVRRLGEPDDVAGLVTFLASPLASWITGQTYAVNGGYVVTP
jgi:NAD(P)-dependent dehydrogenase (short-subunit alcohol dehydrogenase family)